MSKVIAVNGAGGCLGRELVSQLLTRGDEVIGFSSNPQALMNYLQMRETPIERLCVCDGNDLSILEGRPIATLFNCAFPRSDEGSCLASGLQYIQSFLHSISRFDCGSVVNVSSQSVYSQTRLGVVDEGEAVSPDGKYGVAKYATELMIDEILGSLPHTNIRLASLFGREFSQRFINHFICRIVNKEGFVVKGRKQIYGFLDYRDAASGLAAMTTVRPDDWETVYNLGPLAGGYTMEAIVQTCCEVASEYNIDPSYTVEDSAAWFNSSLDSRSFRESFGWFPTYSLKDTIKDIFSEEYDTSS